MKKIGVWLSLFSVIVQLSTIAHAENEAVISALFRRFLGREPDPSGLATYKRGFAENWFTTKGAIATLLKSEEWQATYATGKQPEEIVRTLYQQILGRPPENAKVMAEQVARLLNDGPGKFGEGMTNTPEYMNANGDWGVPGNLNLQVQRPGGGVVASGKKPDPGHSNENHTPDRGDSKLHINNPFWRKVSVQIRVGNDQWAENNPWYENGTYEFVKDTTFEIHTAGEDVYFRRQSNPDSPDGNWSNWTQIPLSQKQTKDTKIN